jgi:hypothetical protein
VIIADNSEPLTTVVTRGDPFQFTTAPGRKQPPLIVNLKAAPPAMALAGFRVVSAGAPGSTVTVKVSVLIKLTPFFVVETVSSTV